ncbi:MAG: tetratricopeptide repeat protein [Candidatus Muiribacteriota bacterium]
MAKKNLALIFLMFFAVFQIYANNEIPVRHRAENWFFNAKWLLENKRFDKAIDSIDKAIELIPENSEFRKFKTEIMEAQKLYFKIDFNYNLKKFVLKKPALEDNYENFGQNVIYVRTDERKELDLAQQYLDNLNVSAALNFAKRALEKDEKFTDAYIFLGKVYLLNNPQLAYSHFKKAFYINPKPEGILYLVSTGVFLKDFDFVRTVFRIIGDTYHNTDLGAMLKIFENKLELDFLLSKEFERQKVDRIEYLAMSPELSIMLYNTEYIVNSLFKILENDFQDDWFFNYVKGLYRIYFLDNGGAYEFFSKGRDFAPPYFKIPLGMLAEEYRDKAKIILDPNSYEALHMRAWNFYYNGNYEQSIEQATRALTKADDRSDINRLLGLNHFKMGNFETAKNYLTSALEKIKDEADIYFAFGEIYYLERNYYQAFENYKKVIAINPDHVEALFRIGNIHSEQGEFEESLSVLLRVIDIYPDYVDAHILLGNIYTRTNRFEEAISSFNEVIAISPSNVDAYVSLSIVYFKKWEIENLPSMLDSAIQVLEQAESIVPGNDMVRQYLQYYHRQKNQ